jgi:hypothetical protein
VSILIYPPRRRGYPVPPEKNGVEVFYPLQLRPSNTITKLELSVGLEKVKSGFGSYVWEVRDKKFNPFDNLGK